MSIENFDWQGYMSDIGYAPEQIPNEINDEDLQWLYGLWARDLMEKINYDVKRDPFLSTAKEKRSEARKRFLYYAPDMAHFFGDEVQPNDPNTTFDPEAFRQHVINNEVQNANLGYYLDTFAASRINEDTDAKWPWLKGLTKDQFKKSFMEQQDIDEAWTSVDDIRNGNFGTLSAKYQEQLARQQGIKGNEKSGHMAALKQGWYEFEKLFGYTAGTLGDATGIQWLSDIGNEIAQNVIQKSDAYNYQSKYNESLADTIKNQGFMAAGGKILNMAEENWATTAAPLALAAIGKILSTYAHVPQPLADAATRAVAANVVRRQGANLLRRASQLAYASSAALSGLEIGGVRAELEEHGKYDPNNVADVVAAGLVSSSLDFVGNVAAMKGIGITASRLWTHRLAVNEARARLAREIAEDQAKSFTHRVLSAMAIEGVTEGLQEIPAMVVGARRGIEYTPKEVRDRIIDAAAVGAFMGAGIRAGEIALEKYHRGDGDDTPTPTSTEQEPGETPEAAPQTEPQPPPPGFDGAIPPFVTWRQMENGFSVHDEFNVGYGATHEEAARNFIDNANKGRVDIDPNRITFVPGSQAGESWVIARYGENGKNSVKVIGQDKERYIRKIIELHNDPNNAVNLQGDNVFRTDEFRSNNSQLNEDEFIRSILEQKKTKFGSDSRVTAARRDTVDIPVSFDALPRGDRPGTYVTFNLDEDTRTSLRDKGFTILSEPRSKKKGRVQVLRLHRDGFIYTVTLTNNESDQGARANVKAESIYNLVHGKKGGGFSFESDIDEQVLRAVDTDAVTNVSSSREVKYAVTLSPTLRPGFIEIDRNITPEGRESFTFDPRDVLKKRVEAAKGKIENVGERNISYTSAGETTRLDITADGRVLVSRDGRFIGDYDFVAGDIGDSTERAIVQSSKIEGQQLFHVVDIPEELQFEGRVTFVYRDDLIGRKVTREYFAIKNDGSVHFIPPAEMNYVDKLLRLPHIQNLNDARDVFGHQFIEFYALPEFYNDGEVRQFVGFKTENNLLPAVNLEDPILHRFDDMQVDELISAGYNEDFVKVWAIIAPNGEIVRATTEEGVDAFISDIKNYANIIDDSEWNPSSRGESIFGEAYTERGLYTERDLYGTMYEAPLYGESVTDEEFNTDSDAIRKAAREVVNQIKRDLTSLRKLSRKTGSLISKDRTDQFEFIAADLSQNLEFYDTLGDGSSQFVSSYLNNSPREFNEAVRRKLYRLRAAQAILRIDLYRANLGGIINKEELDRILTDEIGDYNASDTMEHLRERAIQAESIAVRLEEAYVDFMRSSQATQTANLLWEAIYPDSTEAKYGSFVDRIHSEGTDFRFSRAAETPRVQRKINLLDELNNDIGTFTLNEMLERGLRGESGGLVILPDQEAAHEIERRFTTDATQPYYDDAGLIQGFVAPDGIMYLVEDGIVDGKGRQIILHEYGVHARKFGMSDAQFQEVVQNIKAKRDEKSAEGDFVRHCITRAKQANRNMSEDNPIFWEEVAAYAVEDGYHLADTGIVGRMQTWMKNWLWRFGVIDASAFHYQDFVNMAQGMLGNPGPLSFFDGTHDYTKYQDSWKNLPKFSRTILAEDSPDREEFAQRTYRRLRGLDDAIDRERNGENADSIEQATDWRRNDNGDWGIRYSRINVEGARRLDISDPRGLTTRMMEYDLAVQMEAEGRSEAEIKALTNWTRGNDGLWGYEVVDKDMTFEIPGLEKLKSEIETLSLPKDEYRKYLVNEMQKEVHQKYFPGAPETYSYQILSWHNTPLQNYIRYYEQNFLDMADIDIFRASLIEEILQRTGQVEVEYTDRYGNESTVSSFYSHNYWPLAIQEYEHALELLNDRTLSEEQLIARLDQESQRILSKYNPVYDDYWKEYYSREREIREAVNNEFPEREKRLEELKKELSSLYKTKRNLSTVLDHSELFNAYPELKDVQISFESMWPWESGYMKETENSNGTSFFEIVLNENLDEESMRGTLIHEVQHVIQALSGFARGGNTRIFEDVDHLQRVKEKKLQSQNSQLRSILILRRFLKDYVIDGYLSSELYNNRVNAQGEFLNTFYVNNKPVNNFAQFRTAAAGSFTLEEKLSPTLREQFGETFYNYLKQEYSSALKEVERDYNEAQQRKLKADNEYRELTDEPYQKYRRLMGELEARVTQRRMNMTEEEMRETPISETEREFEGIEKEELIDPRDLKEVVNGEPGGESEFRYSRATAEELKPYSSFINTLENDLVSQRISGVPREGDTVLYQRGDVNEFITRDSLYTIEDADDYYPDLEQRWIDYHRDDSESNFIRYSRSILETNGFRYSFAGEIGAAALDVYEEVTTRMDNLAVARQMEEAGKDAKAIKYATGWERGADNKWRYEIDDSVAIFDVSGDAYYVRTRGEKYVNVRDRIRELEGKKRKKKVEKEELERLYDDNPDWVFHLDFMDEKRKEDDLRLYDFLQHRELYDAYPQLEDTKVRLADLPDHRRGHYVPGANLIELNKNLIDTPEEAFGVLLHEVQHIIQKIEGFSRGGSVDEFKDENKFRRFTELVNEMVDTKRNYRDLVRNFVVKNARRYIEEWNEFQVNENGEFSEPYNLDGKDINNLYELGYIVTDYMIENDINPNTNLSDIIHGADLVLHDFFEKEGFYKNIPTDFDEILEQYKLQEAELSLVSQEPEDIYRRLAGEVEARNVESRLTMTMEQRRTSLAEETERGDVAREDQIILENMLNEASSAIRYSRTVPTGEQKQAGVIYPNMGEEISGFRYSIGKAAREEYRAQLEEGRKDFTPEQIENVLKELDKYHDAKQYKKVKAALHWVIRGRVILPEDEKKIEEAIKTAENAKVDLIGNLKDYESPLDFINKYKEFKPKVPPIDPSTVPEFSDPLDLGDGIITYEVQDTKEGQQAMREIINTHWGEDANPWCLLQGDGKGNLTSDSWTYWSVNYSGLPKRVAFKNGKLLSFMATNRAKDTTIETSLTALKNWISSGKLREVLYQYSDNKVVSEYLNYSNLVKSLDFLRTLLRRGNGIFVYEAQSNYGINYLRDENLISEDLRSKLDDAFNNQRGREIFESFERDRTEWLRAVEDAIGELITSGFDRIRGNFDRWLENDAFKISYLDDSTAVIVDESGKRIDIAPLWYTPFSEEFRKQDDGTFIARVQMPEQWWDRNDESHPNLDWARDTPVSGLRYSRAATIDDVPQTPRQRGTQVPNAPGMYKMPDGSLHIEPSELPVGFESETILYAAIAISDPAKEEPKVAELREFITADENLMRLTDQMMEQRKDTNEDHRLGYAVSLILEAYDPASDIYQQTVDAFHEAVSKATGGAYQNLVLDTGQIEAAAHAAAGIPYEPLLTAPQETVPTPRPNTADMEHLRRQEMFAASDAQRAEMQVGEDGRAYISTDDSDVDVVFESKVNTPFDTGRLVDDVLIGASRQGEDDDFYNHLADSPHHGTQEPLDTGRFALPADQHRQEVERFLADSIPEHIWRRVEILWEDNAENNAILGNALGLFKPRSWKNKNIFIKGWNRSFGQVVRTAAREASRFGWGMWQNRDFRRAITEFYDMFQAKIYDELRPYYNQMGITDPAQLSDGQKIYMVQTFFSKMNQSLFTDDQGNIGDLLGISQTEYRRILADVRSGVAAQERDLSAFVEGVANDPELAKRFAAEMLRMTMEASTKMGVHFTYERSSRLGGKDRIRVFTNEWGTYRRKIPNTRFGLAAEEIKKNLRWWRERFNAGEGAEKFARQIMRNLPMSMRYPLEWMHLYVPHARLGDTTLGRASQMISRVWQRIGDTSGTTLARDYALMEDIHGILRAHNYDPLMADDMGNRSYRQFFQGLGITSEKDLKKADMADAIVTTAERLKTEGEARIRETIMETGLSLWNRMLDADFSQRDVNNMVNRFEGYRQRFMLDHYSHRMYEAFTPEGRRELSMLLNYLRRDPRTGEHTLAKRAKEARDAIARAQARYGAATSEFYRETKEARDDLRRWERLQHLWNREMGNAKKYKGLVGAELNAKVVEGMERYILAIVSDSKTHGRFDPQAVPHYNAISAQKARSLDPNNPLDKELMDFLLEIKDPIRNAVYTLDQQRQLITKLEFNKELGEYLLDNNMAGLRSQPDADGLARDLAHMETGSFLEYVNVDPEFMPEIKAEWENMQKVTDTVLSGVVDAVKANSTVYSLRLMMNNYIGNASMLLASGHIWRFKNYLTAGEVIRKQFLDRFTYGAKDPSDFAKMILREMEQNMITGGSGTEMSVFQLNKGAHERFVQTMTQMLYAVTPLTKRGKFKMDNFVAKLLEKARAFYTYGDEWVKPLIYLNNRASAIAKYQAVEKRYDGETEEDYQERVLKKAIEEASEQTIRETVSWENSPFFVRQLSTRSVRFFAPDFLLHNFQMLRITAANYVRWFGALDELRNFDPSQMNPDKVEAYRSELKKELVRRGVGGAMTAGVYAGLIGATGSCMAYIPYMMNTLMAAIDGEDDKDKDNTFFNPQEWEGAQRILNYKTGGDNFFVPAWRHDGKIYAWNYGRASVMLTHAIPQPATENPEFSDYAAQFFKNIVAIGGGTIAQEIVNNFQGKDKWGRDIGVEAGWWRIFDRVFVPGAIKQVMDMSVGYPGSDNPYREGKAIKMSDAVGITVNAYDMRDIVNELAWDMARVGSNSQNVVRKSFVKRLTQSDALSDSDVASMIGDMREDNARHMDRANYLLTGLRQMGMENKELQHWLTTSRKDAGNILSKKQATAFLKGHNVYDDALVTYLKNKRNNLAKGKDDVRMSREELGVVLQNYDKAIRIYSQALRPQ